MIAQHVVEPAARSGSRRPLARLGVATGGLVVLGWGAFALLVLPAHTAAGGFGWGVALTAFLLGARHAFDADHIAAIDNTTRKLVGDGGRPVSVGFWFALGHSTVVATAVAVVVLGIRVLTAQIVDADSSLAAIAGVWGPAVSGSFLLLVGAVNLGSLVGIRRLARRFREGRLDEAELERRLAGRGVGARLLGPLARTVDRPRRMYLVGLLFGLGFDTASTVSLVALGTGSVLLAPWYVVMVLPVLFTAGMVLFDTLDGVLMHRAYQWAFAQPARKIRYNSIVTALSVGIAFCVGGLALIGVLAELVRPSKGPLAALAGLDLGNAGFVIAAALLATWLVAAALGRRERAPARE